MFNKELYTILKAVNIVSPEYRRILACSDSFGALQTLQNMYSWHPLIEEILSTLGEMDCREAQVSFCWIPSHVGIPGNEHTDSAAKDACSQLPFTKPIVADDFISLIKNLLLAEWQGKWTATIDKLHKIKKSVLPWALLI